uniref:Uncharacterized protein n=1 Tax=Pipistrellus kuhlii TaxID=59472 RepID=A0A7J7V0M4_PIPKU|nr:hypothetical protein mPipKuh1_008614 [Pipistrellus kuhlii]
MCNCQIVYTVMAKPPPGDRALVSISLLQVSKTNNNHILHRTPQAANPLSWITPQCHQFSETVIGNGMCTCVFVFTQAKITWHPSGLPTLRNWAVPLIRPEHGSGCHVEKGLQVEKVVGDVPRRLLWGFW